MNAVVTYQLHKLEVDFSNPVSISTLLQPSENNVLAWHVEPPKIDPVITDQFTGSVKLGGAVNFKNIFFNPHGHGTHTECVGHISKEDFYINDCLDEYNFIAKLISVSPETINDDKIIMLQEVERAWNKLKDIISAKAIIIRTLPNNDSKLSRHYSGTNPPYLHHEVVPFLLENGIEHLLIDTPSVDREEDNGELICHHLFWEYPHNTQKQRTITELVYVPNEVSDGFYFLNLQPVKFQNDAAPCNPIIYKINNFI